MAKSGDQGCFDRSKARGQRTFTLVAQDASAPTVIAEWIKQNIETAPSTKLRDALESAMAMRIHVPRKRAD